MACSDAVAVPGKPKPDWRERKERYIRHLDADADADVLLVSACDKVHNASSILADLRTEGDDGVVAIHRRPTRASSSGTTRASPRFSGADCPVHSPTSSARSSGEIAALVS